MRAFLDTSVLVSAFHGDHIHHQPSLRLLIELEHETGCCGAHSLAEFCAAMTRTPS